MGRGGERAFVRFDDNGTVVGSRGTEQDIDVLQSLFRALHALATRSIAELGAGRLTRLILDGTQGRVLLADIEDGTVVAFVGPDEPLGTVLAELRVTR
ncbi:MAG: roadblock/LC7 domain-containing protein [Myxococcota bacterium]